MTLPNRVTEKIPALLDGLDYKSPVCRAAIETALKTELELAFGSLYEDYLLGTVRTDEELLQKEEFVREFTRKNISKVERVMATCLSIACGKVCTDTFIDLVKAQQANTEKSESAAHSLVSLVFSAISTKAGTTTAIAALLFLATAFGFLSWEELKNVFLSTL